ncbi:hypothetical protein Patl1_15526 [Pistacia atlantica]|uniref:Uncharacterized protein n=1 Tax=Pistacia atlantica TaxID=434234 RepID=A0ACC1BBF5_9ROSI|nr:hypothetical protein Patl1_15526 [Pistacia atlantica]
MADAVIPTGVLRNLADKLYEKRKNAALEVEGIVKQLAMAGDHEKISTVINLLTHEFTYSPQANHRKGGLIGLAAATVGLTSEAAQHLESGEWCGVSVEWRRAVVHLWSGEGRGVVFLRSAEGEVFLRGAEGEGVWTRLVKPNTSKIAVNEALAHLNNICIKFSRLLVFPLSLLIYFFLIFCSDATLQQIVPPVLNSFSDQDSRVRYYACEALYNIAKVVRGDFIIFFNQIFDALCKLSADSDANVQSAAHLLDRLVKDIVTESDQFSIEEFIPLLRERMNVLNPYVRQFLVGWITVLDSVPDIDMLGFLPDFLDGLFNMLSDSSHEIRQQADSALSEFLQEIKNSPSVDYGRMAEILVQRAASPDEFTRLTAITWINEFVKLGGDQLVPYYADILGAILPCISDKEEKIRVVARETNEELRAIQAEPAEGFDVGAILSIARRQLSSEWEATRIEALHWISTLLNRHRAEVTAHLSVLIYLNEIFDTLLKALSDPSDEVVLLVIEVHACIAKDPQHFRQLVVFLVHNFRIDNSLLEKRGALIIRRLCVLLDAKRVYLELSTILEGESDLDFACIMVQTYQHVSTVIQSLVEEDINVKFLVQLDKLIRLLETPTFAYLRLQLLEPGRYTWLLKALYGLLMLLPQQSAAFKILRTRLKTIPSYSFNGEQFKRTSSGNPYSLPTGSQFSEDGDLNSDMGTSHSGINFNSRLQQFEQMQHQHRMHVKAQVQLRNSSTSVSKEVQRPQEPHQLSPSSDGSRPSSRSSKKGPGQLQL